MKFAVNHIRKFFVFLIIIFNTTKAQEEDFCYSEEFDDNDTGIFDIECDGSVQMFEVYEYENSAIPPPEGTNGYFLSPPTDTTGSCITMSTPLELEMNTNISITYYVSGNSDTCLFMITSVTQLFQISIDDSRTWTTRSIFLQRDASITIQLLCSDMGDAQLAIEHVRFESDSETCNYITTTESTTGSSEDLTESTSESTTDDDLNSTSESTTNISTESETTPDESGDTTTPIFIPTTENTNDIDFDEILSQLSTWRIISIIAIVLSALGIIYSVILTIILLCRRSNPQVNEPTMFINNDSVLSNGDSSGFHTDYTESSIPRLHMNKEYRQNGDVCIEITGRKYR